MVVGVEHLANKCEDEIGPARVDVAVLGLDEEHPLAAIRVRRILPRLMSVVILKQTYRTDAILEHVVAGAVDELAGLTDVVHVATEALDGVKGADREHASLPVSHVLAALLEHLGRRLVRLGVVEQRPGVNNWRPTTSPTKHAQGAGHWRGSEVKEA